MKQITSDFLFFFFSIFLLHPALAVPVQKVGDHVDIVIANGETRIAGTLALPSESKTTSLVVMLSGSGPQDRDSTLAGFPIFSRLATHFSSQGIASFRFDDRGVGGSTGNFGQTTRGDLSADIDRVLNYFSRHDDVPFSKFILLGHSQGGVVAVDVAITRHDVEKVVLLGTPAVPLIDVVLYQVRQQYARWQLDKATTESLVSAHNRLMWAIQSNSAIDSALVHLQSTIFTILSVSLQHSGRSPDELRREAAQQAQELSLIYALPSLTSFLYHDPALRLTEFKVPVLALLGGKDRQVTIEQNKDVMEKAILKSGVNHTFVIFENANHYFQKAKIGTRQEYDSLDSTFVAAFLPTVSGWILKEN